MEDRPISESRAKTGFGAWIAIGLAACALLAYGAPIAWLAFRQRDLLFHVSTLRATPDEAGFSRAREVAVRTADGETLVGWFIPPAQGKPFLIYLHGNAGTLEKRAVRLQRMTDDGAGLLAIEWRGYGGSTGSPSQDGLLSDARAAYDYAIGAGAAASRIVVVGESLGTGPALWLAGARKVAGVVLDSPYSAIVDVGADTYWMFPVRLIARDPFPAAEWAAKVQVPVFAVAGDEDRTIPVRYARKLMAAISAPRTFIEIPGAGHVVLGRPDILPKANAWIAEVAK
ncbi:MAG TPA: alpha/beta fold hydrolase [Rhodoblastus sp.]|nr:alpha/beta fold hydrolase [Rhodoblastus sp.]